MQNNTPAVRDCQRWCRSTGAMTASRDSTDPRRNRVRPGRAAAAPSAGRRDRSIRWGRCRNRSDWRTARPNRPWPHRRAAGWSATTRPGRGKPGWRTRPIRWGTTVPTWPTFPGSRIGSMAGTRPGYRRRRRRRFGQVRLPEPGNRWSFRIHASIHGELRPRRSIRWRNRIQGQAGGETDAVRLLGSGRRWRGG